MSLWKSRKPDTSFDTEAPNEAETAEAHLSGYLFGWMRRAKRSTLPSPLPIMANDAAQWWLATMCPKPPMMIDGDDKENARLHSSHVASCRSSLRGFLSLTTHQRQGVVNMCTDGGLKLSYRGESFPQFVSIAEEADVYADNPDQYVKKITMRVRHVLGMMQWNPEQKHTNATQQTPAVQRPSPPPAKEPPK